MKKVRILFCIILLLMFCQFKSFAQQNIISIPSADILKPGEILLKQSTDFRPFQPDAFVLLSPYVSYGIEHNINIAAGTNINITDETDVKGRFALKKVIFLSKDKDTRFTYETIITPSFMKAITPNNITYAHFSQKIRKTGTRLTVGMYIASSKDFIPDKPGVVLAFEQSTFIKNINLAMDWTSRNERYGNLGVGFRYNPAPTWSITNAVLIPNGSRGDLAFKVSISKYITPQKY